MSTFEQQLREGIAVLGEANATLAQYPEIGKERKDIAATNLACLIRSNHEYLPLTGFAISSVHDTDHGNSRVYLKDDKRAGVKGRWLLPDSYLIGGDRTSGGPYGLTTHLGVLPRGVYPNVKRFEVILDTLRLASPEEIVPAAAEREKNNNDFENTWRRYFQLKGSARV